MPLYPPNDSLAGPITAAIANLVSTQVQGVTVVYDQIPDTAPEDGSALIQFVSYKIVADTNAKLSIRLMYSIRHFIVRTELPLNIQTAYTYMIPYLQVFSSWANQTLGGLSREMSPHSGGVAQWAANGQPFVCLITNLDVLVDINIPTS